MKQEELDKILEGHKRWLDDPSKGKRADLRYANLRWVKLYKANLRRVKLYRADLRCADLRYANLCEANLREANLRYANLYCADLRGADLRKADLREADLRNTNIIQFKFNRHHAIFNGETILIGCEQHNIQTWLDCYEELGNIEGYSDLEIEMYGDFIKKCEVIYANSIL